MEAQVLCGYCGDEIHNGIDDHLKDCRKRPLWVQWLHDKPKGDAA